MHQLLLHSGKPEDILKNQLIYPQTYFNKLRDDSIATNESVSNIYGIKKPQPPVKPGPPDSMPTKPPPPIIHNLRSPFPTPGLGVGLGLGLGPLSVPTHRVMYPPVVGSQMLPQYFPMPSPFVMTGRQPIILGETAQDFGKMREKIKIHREHREKDKSDGTSDRVEKMKESEPYKQ